jgi:hypothetical protein
MATIEQIDKPVMMLRIDEINIDLLLLLESRYTVIVSQIDNEIVLELYKK